MTSRLQAVKRRSPEAAKEGARRLVRAYGIATSSHRPLPDYLIIGTKRGGTTSLWRNLQRHPQVLPLFPAAQTIKSPHFFDTNWHRGLAWYRSHFPTQGVRDRAAARVGRPVVVGDASPYYMFHPLAAQRVAQTVPSVRLIVMLRNPTDRAYSHYQERRKEGLEQLPFAAALQAESERLHGEESQIRADPGYYSLAHDSYSYLARGRYLEHLSPWLDRFDASRILVLRSEDYFADPRGTLGQVHGFLGLSLDEPATATEHLNDLSAAPMAKETREWLDDYFRTHVMELERRLGRTFDWRQTGA